MPSSPPHRKTSINKPSTMIKMATLVKETEYLWKMTDKKYRDRNLKNSAWQRIAQECDLASGNVARKMFELWRNRFYKNKKKYVNSGNGQDESDTPLIIQCWSFLDYTKLQKLPKRTYGNFSAAPDDSSLPHRLLSLSMPSTPSPPCSPSHSPQPASSSANSSPHNSPSQSFPSATSSNRRPLRNRAAAVPLEETVATLAASLSAWMEKKSQNPDEIWADLIALRLKNNLKKMTKTQKRANKRSLEQLLDDLEDALEEDNLEL